jgi:uncharacterized protein
MAHWKFVGADGAALDRNAGTDAFFELGMMYATGRSVPTDFVTAHKWFNIAVLKGNKEAIRLRREIAAEMSDDDIAAAQRAARDWLSGGEEPAGYRAAAKLLREGAHRVRRSIRPHRAFCHQTL